MRKNIIVMGIVLTSLMILSGCEVKTTPGSTQSTDATTDTNKTIEREIVDVEGLPDIVMSGDEISINIQILDTNNQTQWHDTGFSFDSDSDRLIFNGNKIKIPEESLTDDTYHIDIVFQEMTKTIVLKVANLLSQTIDDQGIVKNPASYDAVINKERSLPSDYVPNDLVTVEVPTCLPNPEIRQLRRSASEALTELFNAAREDDVMLVARSGYRSYATQTTLYNSYVNSYGQEYADKYSARPGTSEHQTGLAMDITAESINFQLDDSFGKTKEGLWLADNAHRYGFVIRYPEGMEGITGYFYEPWHVRYLGVRLATNIYKSGLTLEEYYINLENN